MIAQETLRELQQVSIAERITLIETLLQSIKREISAERPIEIPQRKPFKVQEFNLGCDVHVDRDEIYAERMIAYVCD